MLNRTFIGGSLLGMLIAYYAERRDRELFLQAHLLRDAHDRTEEYAVRLDRLARAGPAGGDPPALAVRSRIGRLPDAQRWA